MVQQPGILNSLDLHILEAVEEDIVRKLSRVWFVTFARHTKFKNSEFTFIFAKPTRRIEEDFHLTREILMVFTPYSTFEPSSPSCK
jgi:hypothetical protein